MSDPVIDVSLPGEEGETEPVPEPELITPAQKRWAFFHYDYPALIKRPHRRPPKV